MRDTGFGFPAHLCPPHELMRSPPRAPFGAASKLEAMAVDEARPMGMAMVAGGLTRAPCRVLSLRVQGFGLGFRV